MFEPILYNKNGHFCSFLYRCSLGGTVFGRGWLIINKINEYSNYKTDVILTKL